MQKLKFLVRYLKYLQQARNKYDIHSPFLYELVTQVFEDRNTYPDYGLVESLKRELLKRQDPIEVNDLGAGSTADKKLVRTIGSITRHSSKPQKYGRLLYRVSRYLEPDNILELGTSMGISAAYLALGYPGSTLTTIEGCMNTARQAKLNLDSLDLRNAGIVTGPFDEALPGYLESVSHLDLAFIDGNHKEEPTINYFEQCLLKTVNTSCILFDDIHWSEGMERAWDHIRNHESVTLSIDLFFMGLVFFRKELSKEHFTIRF